MKYAAIRAADGGFPVVLMCRALGVSRSGYLAWKRRPDSQRAQNDRELLTHISTVRVGRKRAYGSPRVTHALRLKGIPCGRKQIARIMRQAGIRATAARKFRVTTDSKHDRPIASNILNRQFNPLATNQAWVADITYIWTDAGWLYLAAVLDLYSRRIVGWSMKERLTEDLVLDALEMALQTRKPDGDLVHHSDRGSQYAAREYQRVLAQRGITCSMSRKGNCWDNAVMESFFHTLKVECVHQTSYADRDEARTDLFDYIEVFYNRERLHSSLGYLSPARFEAEAQVA